MIGITFQCPECKKKVADNEVGALDFHVIVTECDYPDCHTHGDLSVDVFCHHCELDHNINIRSW